VFHQTQTAFAVIMNHSCSKHAVRLLSYGKSLKGNGNASVTSLRKLSGSGMSGNRDEGRDWFGEIGQVEFPDDLLGPVTPNHNFPLPGNVAVLNSMDVNADKYSMFETM